MQGEKRERKTHLHGSTLRKQATLHILQEPVDPFYYSSALKIIVNEGILELEYANNLFDFLYKVQIYICCWFCN
jgi:hypothetical protein